jgi:hypothetical protein
MLTCFIPAINLAGTRQPEVSCLALPILSALERVESNETKNAYKNALLSTKLSKVYTTCCCLSRYVVATTCFSSSLMLLCSKKESTVKLLLTEHSM